MLRRLRHGIGNANRFCDLRQPLEINAEASAMDPGFTRLTLE